ncbi:hypothetical protein V5P93_003988 [Actinokineospora auranticolor]|uniref:transcriptional regulator n=1 Tax=Actinokineospora auranticolor TaxID=155976 RepID=UPI0011B0353A|nr:transcriptional regulator [Actinokineospora auranticolor]
MQRRQFLTAAAGLVVPHTVLARLDDALVALPAAQGPVTPATVTARLAASQLLFDQAQYAALVAGLPDLLAAAHELADLHPDSTAEAMVAACYDLATHTLDKLGQHQASRLTADRAMNHARSADSPLALALSARALSVVLRHEGRSHLAQRITLDAITTVQDTGLTTPAQRTVLTQTLCAAAYSAATSGDKAHAVDLIGAAEHAVRGLGRPVVVGGNVVTAAQVQLYKVGVHWAAGDSGRALDTARGLRPEQLRHRRAPRTVAHRPGPCLVAARSPRADRGRAAGRLPRGPTELTSRPAIRRIGSDLVHRHPHTAGARELSVVLRAGA